MDMTRLASVLFLIGKSVVPKYVILMEAKYSCHHGNIGYEDMQPNKMLLSA